MNQQQLPVSGPPVASSSRLPPIKTLQRNHSFDDQDQAQAVAALLEIKRSPSSAHAPLLPSFQEIHSPYSYPTPGSNGDRNADSSRSSLFPYLPPIRTNFEQYRPPGTTSAGPSTVTPAYFPSAPPTTSFLPYQYPPNVVHSLAHPHSPSSPPRKRKRTSLPELAPSSDRNGKAKYRESELPIDVEGDGDQEMGVEVKGAGNDEGEGEVRCICHYNVDDGFTIQCERCHVWQHAACFSIPSDAVPEVYLCERCNPQPRQLDYEGARRMQQQRLGAHLGSLGGIDNSRAVIGTGMGPSTAARGGARKRRGSPKVERKSRGGATGGTKRRGSNAAQQAHASTEDTVGGGRKLTVASGRRKEQDSSSNSGPQHQQRLTPLHPSHHDTTINPPFATAQPSSHQAVTRAHSFAPRQNLAHPPDHTLTATKPWTQQYVPITRDIVHPTVRPALRSFAHAWRGVTAFSDAETGTHDELSPITSCTPMPAPDSPNSSTGDATASDMRKTFLHPLSSALAPPLRPPTYTLHALRPIARQSYVVPYTCAITPSRDYLREPTSQYAQLGVPKQGVHLVPPPLELCLDARGVGGEGRWVRSGCHPNAVLRPVVCGKGKQGSRDQKGMTEANGERGESEGNRSEQVDGRGSGVDGRETRSERKKGGVHSGRADNGVGGGAGSRTGADCLNEGEGDGDSESDESLDVTFGVFAIRDLKAEEEIVLGWEWDDRHVVHELPRLLKEGYGGGTPALKRAMGEVLSTLFSTFTTCACGASAHNCAITQMQRFADLDPPDLDPTPDPELLPHEQQQHRTSNLRDQRPQPSLNLGPLIGATRGLRTTDRGQGGREGVEVVSASATNSGHAPSVESVARAFRGVASDSGSDANNHASSPVQKRVHFPVPTPEVVVSSATAMTTVATPSPRKSWERRYSESRSNDTSEDGEDEEEDGEENDGERARVHKPPKKKVRTTPPEDASPSVGGDPDVEGHVWMLEETLPPKMRKNWIKETLRVLNTEAEGHELEEDHVSVQYEAVDMEVTDTGVEHPTSLMEVDSMGAPLQSPSTALASLSLRCSPAGIHGDSASNTHVIEVTEVQAVPEAPEAPEVPETLEVLEVPMVLQAVPSPSPNANVSLPKVEFNSNGPEDSNPKPPSRPHSPTHSPVRSQSIEPPPSPAAASTSPIPDLTTVALQLPSSTANTQPIPSPAQHIPDAVWSTNEPPQSTPASDLPAVPPSNTHDLTCEPPAQPVPASPPPPPPKKPPIKRRTLADWKSRKEKERIAQALLHPPSSTSPTTEDNRPGSTSINTPESKVTVPAPVEAPTSSTGSLLQNTDVRMDDIDNTDSRLSKSPTYERPKENSESKTPPQPPVLTVNEDILENMEHLSSNGDRTVTGATVKVEVKPTTSIPFPSSSVSASLPSRPIPFGSGPDSKRIPPSHSFSSASLPSRPISFSSGADSQRILPSHSLPPELSSLIEVHSARKSSPRLLTEDGEISTSHFAPPPHLPPRPSSRPPSLPPSRPPSHPPSRPRSPPTQPRSFHASSPTPSLPRLSPPSSVRSGPPRAMSPDQNSGSRPRPVPSGPRALRQGNPPPVTSGASSYHGRGYSRPPSSSSRGGFHSYNRSFDRETDRGWSARGRGRGGEWR